MPPAQYLNIQARLRPGGLTRSALLLAAALETPRRHVTINATHTSMMTRARHVAAKLRRTFPYDLNIFLEHIDRDSLSLAPVHLFVPNPEWLRDDCREHLAAMDAILCKTRDTASIFSAMHPHTVFTSFTSLDRRLPHQTRDDDAFLHVAGASRQKGTAVVVEVWQRHPEWPMLTILQHPVNRQDVTAPNISYIPQYLDDDSLRALQNACGVHLCPSEAEGFGHYIVEAMSCGALVVTTAGAPMNELVTDARGVLVPYAHREPQRSGTKYTVDASALEQSVIRVLQMDVKARRILGDRAREWFEENDAFFKRTIVGVVESYLTPSG